MHIQQCGTYHSHQCRNHQHSCIESQQVRDSQQEDLRLGRRQSAFNVEELHSRVVVGSPNKENSEKQLAQMEKQAFQRKNQVVLQSDSKGKPLVFELNSVNTH